MGNVLTVEAPAPSHVVAAVVITIAIALQWRKRETGTSQDNTAAGNAFMTNNQSTYSGLNQPVIHTYNYFGIPQPLPSRLEGTTPESPDPVPTNVGAYSTSRLLSTETDLNPPPQVQEGQQIPALQRLRTDGGVRRSATTDSRGLGETEKRRYSEKIELVVFHTPV